MGGADRRWGGMREQACRALCLPRWRDSSLVGTGSAQHGQRQVTCPVLSRLSWEITSPGELEAWPGLLVSSPRGEVCVQFFLQTSFKAALHTPQGQRRVVMSQPRPCVREPA